LPSFLAANPSGPFQRFSVSAFPRSAFPASAFQQCPPSFDFSFQNFSFSAWHMNPALHDNPWIGCGTSLFWDAAALVRRMPLVWCA
jgi:hypothetical protein